MKKRRFKKENIFNIPNLLTAIRILIAIVLIFMIFSGYSLLSIAILFFIGMFTDLLDGQIARRFNLKTLFGAKFDMVADRILMISTVAALILYSYYSPETAQISKSQVTQIYMILSREFVAIPAFIIGIITKKNIAPKAKIIGKATTVLQAIVFPIILLNLTFSIYLSAITMLVGVVSGTTYIANVLINNEK